MQCQPLAENGFIRLPLTKRVHKAADFGGFYLCLEMTLDGRNGCAWGRCSSHQHFMRNASGRIGSLNKTFLVAHSRDGLLRLAHIDCTCLYRDDDEIGEGD